jgi:hypothetical protein
MLKTLGEKMRMINIEEGLGDDIHCSKCNGYIDTGLECTECGHDMRPEIYPEDYVLNALVYKISYNTHIN